MYKNEHTLAFDIIYKNPDASFSGLMKAAMKANRGSMNPGLVKEALILELTLEKKSLQYMLDQFSKNDMRMSCDINEFCIKYQNKINHITDLLNEALK